MRCRNPLVMHRYKGVLTDHHTWNGEISLQHSNLDKPFDVRKPKVYAVWNDLFHESVPVDFIYWVLALFAFTPRHTYIVLTKRAERMYELMSNPTTALRVASLMQRVVGAKGAEDVPPIPKLDHVWFGTTVGSFSGLHRVEYLCSTPSKVHVLSVEPLVEHVPVKELLKPFKREGILKSLFVIVGCESGAHRRITRTEWVTEIVGECTRLGIPVWLKQLEQAGKVVKAPELFGRQFLEWPGEAT